MKLHICVCVCVCVCMYVYIWTILVVQMVKNLPAMQEIWVRAPIWEDPLEKGIQIHTHTHIYTYICIFVCFLIGKSCIFLIQLSSKSTEK